MVKVAATTASVLAAATTAVASVLPNVTTAASTTVVIAAIVVPAADSDAAAATTASADTGATSALQRVAQELGKHNSGPEDDDLQRGRTRAPSRRVHGAWAAVSHGGTGGYRSCTLSSGSTAHENLPAHSPGKINIDAELATEACADPYSEIW